MDQREAVGAFGDREGERLDVALELGVGELPADEALDLRDGVLGVHHRGGGAGGADEALLITEAHDGGGLAL